MNRKAEIALLIALVPVLVLVWYFSHTRPVASAVAPSFSQSYSPMSVEDPAPHTSDLEATRKTEYTKTVRNIFSVYIPPPPAVPDKGANTHQPQGPQLPSPPPPPPPAQLPPNLKFFGYGTVPVGGARRAFLSDGEEVYIASEGETLLGHFRILRVGNANLEFEDTSTGQRGTKVLEQQGQSPL